MTKKKTFEVGSKGFRDNEYNKMLKKLRQIFKDIDADKKSMVDDILQDYAFLHVDNLILKDMIEEYGSVIIEKLHGTQKQSEAAKQYQRNSNTKNMHTRTLLIMLRGQDPDDDDPVKKFMKENK